MLVLFDYTLLRKRYCCALKLTFRALYTKMKDGQDTILLGLDSTKARHVTCLFLLSIFLSPHVKARCEMHSQSEPVICAVLGRRCTFYDMHMSGESHRRDRAMDAGLF